MKNSNPTKKRRRILLITILILLVLAAGATAWWLLREKSTSDVYAEARANAIRTTDEAIYMSFEAEDSSISVKGEMDGSLKAGDSKLRMDMLIDVESDGVPIKLDMENLGFVKDDKTTRYTRVRSVSSRDSNYNQLLKDYYAPTIGKWQKTESDAESRSEDAEFSENGAIDLMNIASIFMPTGTLSQADKDAYLDTVAKYNLYKIPGGVEEATFKGKDVRKLRVEISKDVFIEVDNELSSKLSDDAEYTRTPLRYVDLVFGDNGVLAADVYLAKDKNEFVGMSIQTKLKEPVKLEGFETDIEDVSLVVLIDYGRSLKLEPPKNALSEDEYSALMNQ